MSVHHWSLGERLSSLNIGAATANHVLATSCNRSLSLSIATIYHTAILKDSSNLFIGAGMSRISSGTTRALEEQEAMRKLFFQTIHSVWTVCSNSPNMSRLMLLHPTRWKGASGRKGVSPLVVNPTLWMQAGRSNPACPSCSFHDHPRALGQEGTCFDCDCIRSPLCLQGLHDDPLWCRQGGISKVNDVKRE